MLVALCLASNTLHGIAAEKPRLPDIVVYLADDLSAEDLALYGGDNIKTPAIDRLAATFRTAVAKHDPNIPVDAIEREWRSLYAVAWADFTRFMLGWCPSHSKLNAYSRRLAEQVTQHL